MAQNSKVVSIAFAMVEGFSYQNAKLGNSDGTVAGTAVAIILPLEETDPHLNSFIDSGPPKLELRNRGGEANEHDKIFLLPSGKGSK
jgi:hypothetical protein